MRSLADLDVAIAESDWDLAAPFVTAVNAGQLEGVDGDASQVSMSPTCDRRSKSALCCGTESKAEDPRESRPIYAPDEVTRGLQAVNEPTAEATTALRRLLTLCCSVLNVRLSPMRISVAPGGVTQAE